MGSYYTSSFPAFANCFRYHFGGLIRLVRVVDEGRDASLSVGGRECSVSNAALQCSTGTPLIQKVFDNYQGTRATFSTSRTARIAVGMGRGNSMDSAQLPLTQIMVLDRALDDDEFGQLYNDGTGNSSIPANILPHVVAWYPMQQNWWEDIARSRAHLSERWMRTVKDRVGGYYILNRNIPSWFESEYVIARNEPGDGSLFFARVANASADYRLWGMGASHGMLNVAPVEYQTWQSTDDVPTTILDECGSELVHTVARVGANRTHVESYGHFQIKMCPGDRLNLVWAGYHNVRETESADCASDGLREVVGFQSSGYQHTFAFEDLAPSRAGAVRYYRCDIHCGATASRFEVSMDEDCEHMNTTYRVALASQSYVTGVQYDVGYLPRSTKVRVAMSGDPVGAGLFDMARPIKSTTPVLATSEAGLLTTELRVVFDEERWLDQPNAASVLTEYDGSRVTDGGILRVYGTTSTFIRSSVMATGICWLTATSWSPTYGTELQAADGLTSLCSTLLIDADPPQQYLPHRIQVNAETGLVGFAYRFMTAPRNLTSMQLTLQQGEAAPRDVRVRLMDYGLHGNFADAESAKHEINGDVLTVRFKPTLTRVILVSMRPNNADELRLRSMRVYETRTGTSAPSAHTDLAFYASPLTSKFVLVGSKHARDHAGDLQPLGTGSTNSMGSFGNASFDDNYVVTISPYSSIIADAMRNQQFTLMFWTVMTNRHNYGHWFRDSVHLRTEDNRFYSVEWVNTGQQRFTFRYGRETHNPTGTHMNEVNKHPRTELQYNLDGTQTVAQFVAMTVSGATAKIYVGGLDPASTELELIISASITSTTFPSQFSGDVGRLCLGMDPQFYVQGQSPITNVILLNRGVSREEIKSDYYNRGQGVELDPSSSDQIAWWPMTRNWWEDVSGTNLHLRVLEGASYSHSQDPNKNFKKHEFRPGEQNPYYRMVGDQNAPFRWNPSFYRGQYHEYNLLWSSTTQRNPYSYTYSTHNYMRRSSVGSYACSRTTTCPTNYRYMSLINLVQVPNQTWYNPDAANALTTYRVADSELIAPAVADAKHYAHPETSHFYYTSRSQYKAQSTSNDYATYNNFQMGHNRTERYRNDWPRYNNILASGTSVRLAQAMNGRSFTFSFWTMLDGKGGSSQANNFRVSDAGANNDGYTRSFYVKFYGNGANHNQRIMMEVFFKRFSTSYSANTEFNFWYYWTPVWFFQMNNLNAAQAKAQMITVCVHPNATLDVYLGNMNPDASNVTAIVKGKTGTKHGAVEGTPDVLLDDDVAFYNFSTDARVYVNLDRINPNGLLAFCNLLVLDRALSQAEVTTLFRTGDVQPMAQHVAVWYPMTSNWWEDVGQDQAHLTEHLMTSSTFTNNNWLLTFPRILAEQSEHVGFPGNASTYFLRAYDTPYRFLSTQSLSNGYLNHYHLNVETVPYPLQRWMSQQTYPRYAPVSANEYNLRSASTSSPCVSVISDEYDVGGDVKYMLTDASGARSPLANGDRLYTLQPRTSNDCPTALLDNRAYDRVEGFLQLHDHLPFEIIYAFGKGTRTLAAVQLTLPMQSSEFGRADSTSQTSNIFSAIEISTYAITSAPDMYTYIGVAPTSNPTHADGFRFGGFTVTDARGVDVLSASDDDTFSYRLSMEARGFTNATNEYATYTQVDANSASFDMAGGVELWSAHGRPSVYALFDEPTSMREFALRASSGRMPDTGVFVASADGVTWTAIGTWTDGATATSVSQQFTGETTAETPVTNLRFALSEVVRDDHDADLITDLAGQTPRGWGATVTALFDPVPDAVAVRVRATAPSGQPSRVMELRLHERVYLEPSPPPPPNPPPSPRPPPLPPSPPPSSASSFTLPRIGVRSLASANWYVWGRGETDTSTSTYINRYKGRTDYTDFPDDWGRMNGLMSDADPELAQIFNNKNHAEATGMTYIFWTILANGKYYTTNAFWGMTQPFGCGLTNGKDEIFHLNLHYASPGGSGNKPYAYNHIGFNRPSNAHQRNVYFRSAHDQGWDEWDGTQDRAQMVAITIDKTTGIKLYIGDDDEFFLLHGGTTSWHDSWNTHWSEWDTARFQCGFYYNSITGGNYPVNNIMLFNRSLEEYEMRRMYVDGEFRDGLDDPLYKELLAWYPMHTGNWWQDMSGNERHLSEYKSSTYEVHSNDPSRTFTNLEVMRATYIRTPPGEISPYYIQAANDRSYSLTSYTPQARNRASTSGGSPIGTYFNDVRIVPTQPFAYTLPAWVTGRLEVVSDNRPTNGAQDSISCDRSRTAVWIDGKYDERFTLANGDTVMRGLPSSVARSYDGRYPLYPPGYFDDGFEVVNCAVVRDAGSDSAAGSWNCNNPADDSSLEVLYGPVAFQMPNGGEQPFVSSYAGCVTDLFDTVLERSYNNSYSTGLHLRYDLSARAHAGAQSSVDGFAIHATGTVQSVDLTCMDYSGVQVFHEQVVEPSVVSGWANATLSVQSDASCSTVLIDIVTAQSSTLFEEVALLREPHPAPPPPPSPPPSNPNAPPAGMLVAGYYPVFDDREMAKAASPTGEAFPIKLMTHVYYMPSGLTQGVDGWYGDYSASGISGGMGSNRSEYAWTVTSNKCPAAHRPNAAQCLDEVARDLKAEVGYTVTDARLPSGCVHVVLSHVRSRVVYNAISYSEVSCSKDAHVRCVCLRSTTATQTPLVLKSRPRPRDPRYDLLRYRLHFDHPTDALAALDGNGRAAPADSFNMSHGAPVISDDVPDGRVASRSLVLNATNRGLRLSDMELALGRRPPYSSFSVSYWSKLTQSSDMRDTEVLMSIPEKRFVDERRIVSPVTEARRLHIVEAGTEFWAYKSPQATNPMEYMYDGTVGRATYVANFAVLMFNRSVYVEELMLVQHVSTADTNRRATPPQNLTFYALNPEATSAFSKDENDWTLLNTQVLNIGGTYDPADPMLTKTTSNGDVWTVQRVMQPLRCTAVKVQFHEQLKTTAGWPRYLVREFAAYGQYARAKRPGATPPYRSHDTPVRVHRVETKLTTVRTARADFARNNSMDAPLAIAWRVRFLETEDPSQKLFRYSAGPLFEDDAGRVLSNSDIKELRRVTHHQTTFVKEQDEVGNFAYFNSPTTSYWQAPLLDSWSVTFWFPQRPRRMRVRCAANDLPENRPRCPTMVMLEYALNDELNWVAWRNVSLVSSGNTRDVRRGEWRQVDLHDPPGVTDVVNSQHADNSWVHTVVAFDDATSTTRVRKLYAGNPYGGALRNAASQATLPLHVPGETNIVFGPNLLGSDELRITDVRIHTGALNWQEMRAVHVELQTLMNRDDPHQVSLVTKAPAFPTEVSDVRIASHYVDANTPTPTMAYAFDDSALRLRDPTEVPEVDRLRTFAHRYIPAVAQDRPHATTFTLARPTLVHLGVPAELHANRSMNASLYNQLHSWGGWSRAEDVASCANTRVIPTGGKVVTQHGSGATGNNVATQLSSSVYNFGTSTYYVYVDAVRNPNRYAQVTFDAPVYLVRTILMQRGDSNQFSHWGYLALTPGADPDDDANWKFMLRNEQGHRSITEHRFLDKPQRVSGIRIKWMGDDFNAMGYPDRYHTNSNPYMHVYKLFLYGCETHPDVVAQSNTVVYERQVRVDMSGSKGAVDRARDAGGFDPPQEMVWYSAVADRGTHTLRCGDDALMRHPEPNCAQTVLTIANAPEDDAPRVLTPHKGPFIGSAALRNSTPHTSITPMGGDPTCHNNTRADDHPSRMSMWVYYDPEEFDGDNYYWRTGDGFINEDTPGPSQPHLAQAMKTRNLYNPYDYPGALLDGIITPAFDSEVMKPDALRTHLNERDDHGNRVRQNAAPDAQNDARIGDGGYFRFDTNVDNRDMTVVLDLDGRLCQSPGAPEHAGRRFSLRAIEIFNKHHPGESSTGDRDYVDRVDVHCAGADLRMTDAGNPAYHEDPAWTRVTHPHMPGSGYHDLLRPRQRTHHSGNVHYTLHDNHPTVIDLSRTNACGGPDAQARYVRLRFERRFSSGRSYGGLSEIRVWGTHTHTDTVSTQLVDKAYQQLTSTTSMAAAPNATSWRLDCAAAGHQSGHNPTPTRVNLNEWALWDESGAHPTNLAYAHRASPDTHLYPQSWARTSLFNTAPTFLDEEGKRTACCNEVKLYGYKIEKGTDYWATDGVYNANNLQSVQMTCPGSSIVHTFTEPVAPTAAVWAGNDNGYDMTGMRIFYASGNLSAPLRRKSTHEPLARRYPPVGFTDEAVASGSVVATMDGQPKTLPSPRATDAGGDVNYGTTPYRVDIQVADQSYGNGAYAIIVEGADQSRRPGHYASHAPYRLFDHADMNDGRGYTQYDYRAYQLETSPFRHYNITLALPERVYLVYYELHPPGGTAQWRTPSSWTVSARDCENTAADVVRSLHHRDNAWQDEWYTWRGTEYLVADDVACAEFTLTIRDTLYNGDLRLQEWALYGASTIVAKDDVYPTWTEHGSPLHMGEDDTNHNKPLSVPLNRQNLRGVRHWSIEIEDTLDHIGNLELMEASFLDANLLVMQPESTRFPGNLTSSDPLVLHDGTNSPEDQYRTDPSAHGTSVTYERANFPILLNYTFPKNAPVPSYVQFAYDTVVGAAPRALRVHYSHGGVYWTQYAKLHAEEWELHPAGSHRPLRFRLGEARAPSPYAHCERDLDATLAVDTVSADVEKKLLLSYTGADAVDASEYMGADLIPVHGATTLSRCDLSEGQSGDRVYMLGSCADVADLLTPGSGGNVTLQVDETADSAAIVYEFANETAISRIELQLDTEVLVKDLQVHHTQSLTDPDGYWTPYTLRDEGVAGRERELLGPEAPDLGRTVMLVGAQQSVTAKAWRVTFKSASERATAHVAGLRLFGPDTDSSRTLGGMPIFVVAGGSIVLTMPAGGSLVTHARVGFKADTLVPTRWRLEARGYASGVWEVLHEQSYQDGALARASVTVESRVVELKLTITDRAVAPSYSVTEFVAYGCQCDADNLVMQAVSNDPPQWITADGGPISSHAKAVLYDGNASTQEVAVVGSNSLAFEGDAVGLQLDAQVSGDGVLRALLFPDGPRAMSMASPPLHSVGVVYTATGDIQAIEYGEDASAAVTMPLNAPSENAAAGGRIRLQVDRTDGTARVLRNTLVAGQQTDDYHVAYVFDSHFSPLRHTHQVRYALMMTSDASVAVQNTREVHLERACEARRALGATFYITGAQSTYSCGNFRRLNLRDDSEEVMCVHFEHTLSRHGSWSTERLRERCAELDSTLLYVPDLDLVDAERFADKLRAAYRASFFESANSNSQHPLFKNLVNMLEAGEVGTQDIVELDLVLGQDPEDEAPPTLPPMPVDLRWDSDVASWTTQNEDFDRLLRDHPTLWHVDANASVAHACAALELHGAAAVDAGAMWYANVTGGDDRKIVLRAVPCEARYTHAVCARPGRVDAPPPPNAPLGPAPLVDRFGAARSANDPPMRMIQMSNYPRTLHGETGVEIASLEPSVVDTLPADVIYAYSDLPVTVIEPRDAVLLHARGTELGCATLLAPGESLRLRIVAHKEPDTEYAVFGDDGSLLLEGVIPSPDALNEVDILVEGNQPLYGVFVRSKDAMVSVSSRRVSDGSGASPCYPTADFTGGWTGDGEEADAEDSIIVAVLRADPTRHNRTHPAGIAARVRMDIMRRSQNVIYDSHIYVGPKGLRLPGEGTDRSARITEGAARARLDRDSEDGAGLHLLVAHVRNRTDGTFDVNPWIPEFLHSTRMPMLSGDGVAALTFINGREPDLVDPTNARVTQPVTQVYRGRVGGYALQSYAFDADVELANGTLIADVPGAHAVGGRPLLGSVDYLSGEVTMPDRSLGRGEDDLSAYEVIYVPEPLPFANPNAQTYNIPTCVAATQFDQETVGHCSQHRTQSGCVEDPLCSYGDVVEDPQAYYELVTRSNTQRAAQSQLVTMEADGCAGATVGQCATVGSFVDRAGISYDALTGIHTGTLRSNLCPSSAEVPTSALSTARAKCVAITVRQVTTAPHAISLHGTVAYTVDGVAMRGPFQGGVSVSCPSSSATHRCTAGIDVLTCDSEATRACSGDASTLDVCEGRVYSGYTSADTFYELHSQSACAVRPSSEEHALVAYALDGRGVYAMETHLQVGSYDACNGHYGPVSTAPYSMGGHYPLYPSGTFTAGYHTHACVYVSAQVGWRCDEGRGGETTFEMPDDASPAYHGTHTPDSPPNGAVVDPEHSAREQYGDLYVYHYHTTPRAPYTLGCYGPVLNVDQCLALYNANCRASPTTVQLVTQHGDPFDIDYRLYCPCFRHTDLSHFRDPQRYTYSVTHERSPPPPAPPPSPPPPPPPCPPPTAAPTTAFPSASPTAPTASPTVSPTTNAPTHSPSASPTSSTPTVSPTASPTTKTPTASPSQSPTSDTPCLARRKPHDEDAHRLALPIAHPTESPTTTPTRSPITNVPSKAPTGSPFTQAPSASPTTIAPTHSPTVSPTQPGVRTTVVGATRFQGDPVVTLRRRLMTNESFAQEFLRSVTQATEQASEMVVTENGNRASVAIVNATYEIIGDDVISEHVYENVYFNEADNVMVTAFLDNVRAEIASTQENVTADQVIIHNYRAITASAGSRRRLTQSSVFVSSLYDVVVNASVTYNDLQRMDLLQSNATRNATLTQMENDMRNTIERSRILGLHTGGVEVHQSTTLNDYTADGVDEDNVQGVQQTASALQAAYSGVSTTELHTAAPSFSLYAGYPAVPAPASPPFVSGEAVTQILSATVASLAESPDPSQFMRDAETLAGTAEILEQLVSAGECPCFCVSFASVASERASVRAHEMRLRAAQDSTSSRLQTDMYANSKTASSSSPLIYPSKSVLLCLGG
ncbi:hypothetical protein CYMTET_2630 [Cymbomonas tetramitiformis]|uniref:Uncharacterized protein n=1 Tax=Cymbomonas tetramitiformis TaxID=36881 RepID=A0AAE0H4W8_9CHLO|nr:hypothetical protein CYMTET_2630 [Cymbomonas tetramitiformis]